MKLRVKNRKTGKIYNTKSMGFNPEYNNITFQLESNEDIYDFDFEVLAVIDNKINRKYK